MTSASELQKRAQRRHRRIARHRKDPRYRRVLGRLVSAGVLLTNEDVQPYRKPITVQDALWAGQVEPRIVELLPALLIKRPSYFVEPTELPADLAEVVKLLRRNETPPRFRGIEGAAMQRWLPSVGHKNKLPSQLKSFRLQASDVALLQRLARELGISQTAAVRRGLRALAARHLQPTRDAAEGG